MMAGFDQGHALVVGVGTYHNAAWNAPITVADAASFAAALQDPAVSAYPKNQVELLHDTGATRAEIRSALGRLAGRVKPEDTAIVFFCGHGLLGDDNLYYLATHDTVFTAANRAAAGTGLSAPEILDHLRAIKSQKLLVILNACFSGHVGPALGEEEVLGAPPSGNLGAQILSTGEGRVLLTASRPSQRSYYKKKAEHTYFGQAILDGLCGRGVANHDGYIGLFELYLHVYTSVKAAANGDQEPLLTIVQGAGPFAVALYPGAAPGALGAAALEHAPPPNTRVEAIPRDTLRIVARAGRDFLLDQSQTVIGNIHDAGRDITNFTLNFNSAPPQVAVGVPFQAPPLPSHFVPRPEVSRELKTRLASGEGGHGTLVVSAVHGMGGVGKSTVAAALAHDPGCVARFPDGVLWVTLGQRPEILPLLHGWIQALGDHQFQPKAVEAASAHLRSLLQGKAVLLVVDDAWDPGHVRPFLAGGPRCRVLITTRDALIARAVGAALYDLDIMTPQQALALLAGRLGRSLGESEHSLALELGRAAGYLPLALELAAAQVAEGVPWLDLIADLTAEVARLRSLENPGVPEIDDEATQKRLSLIGSFYLGLRRLEEERRRRFAWLGVLPEDASLTPAMGATLWETDERSAQETLRYFRDKALLLPGAGSPVAYRLHDLVHDLARSLLTGPAETGTTGELPGLGLALPQAHASLLARYRARTKGGSWHTVSPDGYIHDHLTWHLLQAGDAAGIHALLAEETPTGRNGWYEANDRLGQVTVFMEDVRKASWLETAPLRSFEVAVRTGRQCRYALIAASLNSISEHIPPALISALIEGGVWSATQGLAHARAIPENQRRAEGLRRMLANLTDLQRPPVLREAFEAARGILDEWRRADALSELAPYLSTSQLAEALEAARSIQDEWHRAELLRRFAPHLAAGMLETALGMARELPCDGARADALTALLPRLAPAESSQVLEEVQQAIDLVASAKSRIRARALLATRLPADKQPRALEEALKAARSLPDEGYRARILVELAPHLPAALLAEALAAARHLDDDGGRARTLASLAAYLPETEREAVLHEALRVAEAIHDQADLSTFLIGLARYLPKPLVQRAWDEVWTIRGEGHRAKALAALAPHLPASLRYDSLRAALRATRTIGAKSYSAEVLSLLVTHLPPTEREETLREMLRSARAIGDEEYRARGLATFGPHLPLPARLEWLRDSLRAALAISDHGYRARALVALAPQLPQSLLEDALRAAAAIDTEAYRAEALAGLAAYLPEALQSQALKYAQGIGSEGYRARALLRLAEHVVPSLVPEMLLAAEALQAGWYRAEVLSALAPHLPPPLLPRAVAAARAIDHAGHKSWAIVALAPYLPQESSASSYLEALVAIRQIKDEGEQAEALAGLSSGLPETLLAVALEVAGNIRHANHRSEALTALALRLPAFLLGTALHLGQAIETAEDRIRVLTALLPRLPDDMRSRATDDMLRASRALDDDGYRAKLLVGLAPYLTGSGLTETLAVARGMEDEAARAEVLAAVALHLPPPDGTAVFREAFQCVLEIPRSAARSEGLAALAQSLPESLLGEALEAAGVLPYEGPRSEALAALAARTPASLLPRALALALGLEGEGERARVLAALAPGLARLPRPALFELWTELLQKGLAQTRRALLLTLESCAPVLLTLGGSKAAAETSQAIQDVGRWWP
jgi:hypothetical protein